MAITFRQITNSATTTGAATTFALSFGSTVAAGSIIVVAAANSHNTTTPTITNDKGDSVTDSGKGVITATVGAVSGDFQIVAFLNPTAGAQTVTLHFGTGTPAFAELYLWEIAGFTSPQFDQVAEHADNSGSTSPASGNTGTLQSANEAAIGYTSVQNSATGGGGNWLTGSGTITTGNNGDGVNATTSDCGEHQVVSATTALNATFGGGNQGYIAWCATFMSGAVGPVGNMVM